MVGGLDLPTLIQRIRLDADTSGGEKDAQSAVQRIGSTITKAGVGLTAAVTVPLIAFGKAGIDAASDLGESMSKVNVVFGESGGVIRDFAKGSAANLGISEQGALEAAGTFGNLFRALGLGVGPAADMSTSLVTLAADLASFNNANPEDVLLALRSGLLGEAEPLRQFGVSLSAARIEAEALSSGLVKPIAGMDAIKTASLNVEVAAKAAAAATKEHGKESIEARKANDALGKAEEKLAAATKGKVPELTAAQKAQAAYNVIQKDTALAQGDFARTSDGLANQQRILSAEFENVKASIGTALLPIMQKVVTVVLAIFDAYQKLGPEGQAIVKMFVGVAAAVGPALIVLGKLGPSLIDGAKSFGSMVTGIADFVKAIPGYIASAAEFIAATAAQAAAVVSAAAAQVAAWVATAASAVASAAAVAAAWLVAAAPFIAVGVAVAAVVLLIVKNWDTISSVTKTVWNGITSAVTSAVNAVRTVISTVFEAIKTVVTTYVNVYRTIIETAWKVIETVVTTSVNVVKGVVTTVFDFIRAYIQTVVTGWQTVISTAWGVIRTIVSTAVEGVRVVIETALGVITGIWSAVWTTLSTLVTTGWTAIRTALDSAVTTVLDFFRGLWGMISGAIGDLVSKFTKLGKDAIGGFVKGLADAALAIPKKVGGIFGSVISVAKGVLDSHSPSKVFLRLGGDTVLGFIKGFEDKKATLDTKIKAMFQSAVSGVQAILGGINAKRSLADATQGVVDAQVKLDKLRGDQLAKAEEIAKAEDDLRKARDAAAAVTLEEERAILLAKKDAADAAKAAAAGDGQQKSPEEIRLLELNLALLKATNDTDREAIQVQIDAIETTRATREAELALADARAGAKLDADALRLLTIESELAQKNLTQTYLDAVDVSKVVEEHSEKLNRLRDESIALDADVLAAVKGVTDAKLELISAELALLTAGLNLVGMNKESRELWDQVTTKLGLNRTEVGNLTAEYRNLQAAIEAAIAAAERQAALAPKAPAPKVTVPIVAPKPVVVAPDPHARPIKVQGLAEGGEVASRGLVWVGENGRELLDLPGGARVIPLDRAAKSAAASTAAVPFIGGNFIGQQIINGVSAADVERANQRAMDAAVRNWGVGA